MSSKFEWAVIIVGILVCLYIGMNVVQIVFLLLAVLFLWALSSHVERRLK